jgi:hypothetical protein
MSRGSQLLCVGSSVPAPQLFRTSAEICYSLIVRTFYPGHRHGTELKDVALCGWHVSVLIYLTYSRVKTDSVVAPPSAFSQLFPAAVLEENVNILHDEIN